MCIYIHTFAYRAACGHVYIYIYVETESWICVHCAYIYIHMSVHVCP